MRDFLGHVSQKDRSVRLSRQSERIVGTLVIERMWSDMQIFKSNVLPVQYSRPLVLVACCTPMPESCSNQSSLNLIFVIVFYKLDCSVLFLSIPNRNPHFGKNDNNTL